MEQVQTSELALPLLILSALSGAGLLAAAFYGWMQFGSTMVLTLGEIGLVTCL